MNVCPACSTENLDGETVCHQCGGPLSPPPTVDCVVCAAPVKIGAKFCKRCGSAQPDAKVAAPAAGRQAHAEDDGDNDKTVIMSPQAREAFMAQHMAQRPQPAAATPAPAPAPAPAPIFAPTPAPAPEPADTVEPAPRVAEVNDTPPLRTMRDLPRTKPPKSKRNWLPIALGAGAFVVAVLVSTLLVMSGSSDEPVSESLSDIGAYPAPYSSAPVEAASIPSPAPAVLSSAPVAELASAPAPQEVSTPAVAPAVIAAPAVAPVVSPAAAAPATPVQTLPTPVTPPQTVAPASKQVPKPDAADAATTPKPKTKPKQDSGSAAAKRKQAEDALNRLLNQ